MGQKVTTYPVEIGEVYTMHDIPLLLTAEAEGLGTLLCAIHRWRRNGDTVHLAVRVSDVRLAHYEDGETSTGDVFSNPEHRGEFFRIDNILERGASAKRTRMRLSDEDLEAYSDDYIVRQNKQVKTGLA